MAKTRILVTGSTDGIGKATAIRLADAGYLVIVHGRETERTEAARRQVIEESGNKEVSAVVGDFARFADVAAMADDLRARFSDLKVLINNAGVVMNERRESYDGHEITFQVNHLSPFLLTNRLLPVLTANAPARIVTVSSMVHTSGTMDFDDLEIKRGYRAYSAYGRSKLANILFTFALARRLEGTGVTANALHPGVISTKLLHKTFSGGAPVEDGTETPVYLATSSEVEGISGAYFAHRRQSDVKAEAKNEELQERLWEVSEDYVKAYLGSKAGRSHRA
jgi:NAD(P)-dependent dehydrogenase (short-subunit alcohol dehydrogenase family)